MILIKNGTVFPMTSPPVENGGVLIDKGKIVAVSPLSGMIGHIERGKELQTIDAEGGWILPGLVESHCHIGLIEDKKGGAANCCNEAYDPVTPQLSALDGVNPMDAAFTEALRAGITTVMVGPGSSNVVCGQFIAMKTYGKVVDDMVMLAPAAMKIAFGENPVSTYGEQSKLPSTRMAVAAMLREELFKACEYKREKEAAEKQNEPFSKNFRRECWLPVLERKIPLKAHVHRADDIMTALRIADEFGLDITLDHCTEGYIVADRIRESCAPAIVGPFETFRNKSEVENLSFENAARLHRAGILVSITTDHPVSIIKSLPLCAGLAVKAGLPLAEGLRAITVNAAKILRLENRIGTLEVGTDADIAVYSGNPMETFTKTLYTLVDGRIVYREH